MYFSQTIPVEKMTQYKVKIDSSGRIYLPKKVRNQLGNTITLRCEFILILVKVKRTFSDAKT